MFVPRFASPSTAALWLRNGVSFCPMCGWVGHLGSRCLCGRLGPVPRFIVEALAAPVPPPFLVAGLVGVFGPRRVADLLRRVRASGPAPCCPPPPAPRPTGPASPFPREYEDDPYVNLPPGEAPGEELPDRRHLPDRCRHGLVGQWCSLCSASSRLQLSASVGIVNPQVADEFPGLPWYERAERTSEPADRFDRLESAPEGATLQEAMYSKRGYHQSHEPKRPVRGGCW